MTRIICAEDCGNSPKMQFLKDFTSALARGHESAVLTRLAEDIEWEWVGSAPLRGREAVSKMLARLQRETRQEVVIRTIVTHGAAGSVNGTLRLTNGRSYGFCHVFDFTGAKGALIRRITSYEIRR